MAGQVIRWFLDPEKHVKMKDNARQRAKSYHPEIILKRLLQDTGMPVEMCVK